VEALIAGRMRVVAAPKKSAAFFAAAELDRRIK